MTDLALHPPPDADPAGHVSHVAVEDALEHLEACTINLGADTAALRDRLKDPAFRRAIALLVTRWLSPTIDHGELTVIVLRIRIEGTGTSSEPIPQKPAA